MTPSIPYQASGKSFDPCEAFEKLVVKLSIPGLSFQFGLMDGRFYFQPQIVFEDQCGLKIDHLGRYYFPEKYDLTEKTIALEFLRKAAAEAFADLVNQRLCFAGHRPFSLPRI